MGTLKLNTTSGGSVSIQAADGASDNTVTLPAVSGANIITSADSGTITQGMIGSGVAGSGPAFRASASGAQTISNTTFTKIVLDTEIFDTNNNFDSSTNYRFTPTVAGYYFIHGMVRFSATTASKVIVCRIYKNGSYYVAYEGVTGASDSSTQASGLVYMNGSTDYVELYSYQNSGGNLNTGTFNNATVFFEGFLVRGA